MSRSRGPQQTRRTVPALRPLIAPLLVLLFSALTAGVLAGLAGWMVGGFGFMTVLVSGAAVLAVNRQGP